MRIRRVLENVIVKVQGEAGLLCLLREGWAGGAVGFESDRQVFLIEAEEFEKIDLALNKIALAEEYGPMREA